MIAVVTNVVLNLTLVQVMGYRGLALGTAIAATLNAGLLLWILQARLGGLEARRTMRTLLSILVASCVMGIAAWLTEWLLELAFPGARTMLRAVRVFASIGVGVLTFAGIARALGIEEIHDVIRRITRRSAPASHV